MIAWASALSLEITGSSMSSGNFPRTRDTLSRTSWAEASTLRLSSNSMVMALTCSRLDDVIDLIPSMVFNSSSSTSVTSVSMTSGLAPSRVVVTETTGGSISGYSRKGKRVSAINPNNTMAALIMLAKIGRLMETSDKAMARNEGVKDEGRGKKMDYH